MKGLIVALVWFVIFLAVTTPVMLVKRREKPFRVFLTVFIASIPPFIFFYFITPANLYLLPQNFMEPCVVVDIFYGLVVYTLLFHNFWDFVYAGPMGFSAGFMVDLERAGERGLSTGQLIDYFRCMDRMDKVFSRRIPNLLRGGYIVVEGDEIRLTAKGRFIARLVLFLKRFVCADEGG